MHHQNIVRLRHAYFVDQKKAAKSPENKEKKKNKKKAEQQESSLLHMVMDYIPTNVFRVQKHFQKLGQQVHPLLTKLYAY